MRFALGVAWRGALAWTIGLAIGWAVVLALGFLP